MRVSLKALLAISALAVLMSGCAQKVQIKALNPAEVGAMATKKKVAVSNFRHDNVGLAGKIETMMAKHQLDKQKYFTVLSRRDVNKVIAEQKLQSSELMDEKTSTRIGKLIGAQAMINGEIASANAEAGSYREERKECLSYYKEGGCARWNFYNVTCNTTQAAVSANINIVNIETGSLIYGDSISKNYSADSCKEGTALFGILQTAPKQILSKGQALNKLASDIADEFVYKLTPHYVYFQVALLDSIELDSVTDAQKQAFANALEFIKAGRIDKADLLLSGLMNELDGRSYVVAFVNGVVKEAQGHFDDAKKLYQLADSITVKPVDEINLAMMRIDGMIAKRDEAQRQINAK